MDWPGAPMQQWPGTPVTPQQWPGTPIEGKLQQAESMNLPAAKPAPMQDSLSFVNTGVSDLARAPKDFLSSWLGATDEAFKQSQGVAQEGVQKMKSGQALPTLAGGAEAVRGTVGEVAAPLTGLFTGPAQWADPMLAPEAPKLLPKAVEPPAELSAQAAGESAVAGELAKPQAQVAGEGAVGKVLEWPGKLRDWGEVSDDSNKEARDAGVREFSFKGEDGKPVYASVEPKDDDLYVHWVGRTRNDAESTDKAYAAKNALGPAAMRQALSKIREIFPDAKTISGNRLSGARPKSADVSVSLPPAKPVPQTLSAGVPAKASVPEKPTRGYISDLSDQLFKMEREHDADKIEMSQFADKLPPEAVEAKSKFFEHLEPVGKPTLTAEEQATFDKTLKPLVQEQHDLVEEIKKLAPDVLPPDFDPDYVHHMVRGKVPEFDEPLGVGQPSATLPYQMSKLPQTTRSLKASRYYVLDDGKGARQVAMLDDKGNLYLMQGKKPVNVPAKDISDLDAVKPGGKFSIAGKEWTLKRAAASEKEAATNLQYYHDAYASVIGNVVRLRKVARAVAWFDNLKSSPEWKAYARPIGGKNIPEGYREPRMPLFRGWAVDPHMADLIDDYYGQRGPIEEKLSRLNQAVVGTLFWQPVTHGVNVATHWTVGRGWDWLNAPQWAGFARDMASAVKDVAQQGPITQALLREGSAQVLPRVINREFYSNVLKALGEDVKKNPKAYDSMLKTIGMKPVEFYKMWMEQSNKALWWASDVFMTHRVLELKRKGLTTEQAIREAEKHIPNYRIPPRVMGSRMISRFMTSPATSEFGRFHYNVWNSYAHIARDLVKGDAKDKFNAIGHIMALGVLGMFVWPAISAGIEKLTGRKGDRASPRGPMTVMQDVKDAATLLAPQTTAKIGMSPSERSFSQILQSVVSLSPTLEQGATQLFGRNPYTGQETTTAGERGQAAADTFNPSQILSDLWGGKYNPTEEALKATVGVQHPKSPAPPQVQKQEMRSHAKQAGQKPVNEFITWLGHELSQMGIRP